MNCSVELARGMVKAKDIQNLDVGSIIQLTTNPEEEAILKIEGTPKYRGNVGNKSGSRAIKITRAIIEQNIQKEKS